MREENPLSPDAATREEREEGRKERKNASAFILFYFPDTVGSKQ